MSHYVGLDVSVKSVTICVVDSNGAITSRGEVSSDPDQIAAFVLKHAPDAARVVHESGVLSIWLTRELEKRGLPIICIDARLAHKASSGRINKSDRGDAEGLAHLARTGWFNQVHVRSEASERIRVLIGTRERLIKMRVVFVVVRLDQQQQSQLNTLQRNRARGNNTPNRGHQNGKPINGCLNNLAVRSI
tara:strand:- start:722 stop:1291 length:570 start_codon:yes stop_codon:yes gene_type:complete